MRIYIDHGWWFAVGIAVDRTGFSLLLPFISLGVDW